MTIYLVTVDSKVSQVAYKTLKEAQEFVKNRVTERDIEGQIGYYRVRSSIDYRLYTITDALVEGLQ